jgi:Metal-dependent hydrolases of the beta-lactamase superfamily III
VTLEQVSEPRPGQRFAFVMDTRLCDAAFALADRADMLVCESTFANAEAALARDYGHLTAGQAGQIAAQAGVRLLVLHPLLAALRARPRRRPAAGRGGGGGLRRRGRAGPGPGPDTRAGTAPRIVISVAVREVPTMDSFSGKLAW